MRRSRRWVETELRQTRRAATAARTAADHDYDALMELVKDLQKVTLSAGQAPIPALLLGATATITVPLTKAMPDTNYSAVPVLVGGANLLSTVVIVGITAQTATAVTVQVRATGVLSAGANITVIAARHT